MVYTTGEMIPFQERKKLRKILYSKTSLVILAVLLFMVADGAWQVYQKARIARDERDRAARSLQDLQTRNAELSASLARIQSAEGVDEDVRQKFAVAQPGEDVVIVVDDSSKKSENSEASTTTGFWAHLASFFGL